MTYPVQSIYPLGQKPSSVPAELLGTQASFPDVDLNATGPTKPTKSGSFIDAILVKHLGATALVPGTFALWSVPGVSTSAKSTGSDSPAGVVDPYLTSNVAQNEYFWLIQGGPCPLLGGATLAANAAAISDGNGKAAAASDAHVYYARQIEATTSGSLKRAYIFCKH